MAMREYDDEHFIAIPRPQYVARARGIHATTKVSSSIRFRLSPTDQKLIEEEAEILKMPFVPFLRWVTVYAARFLRAERTGERYDVDA